MLSQVSAMGFIHNAYAAMVMDDFGYLSDIGHDALICGRREDHSLYPWPAFQRFFDIFRRYVHKKSIFPVFLRPYINGAQSVDLQRVIDTFMAISCNQNPIPRMECCCYGRKDTSGTAID